MGTRIESMQMRRGLSGLGELGVSVSASQAADVENTAKQIEETAGLLEEVVGGLTSAWNAVSGLFSAAKTPEDKARVARQDAAFREMATEIDRLIVVANQTPCTQQALPSLTLAKATLYLTPTSSLASLAQAQKILNTCAAAARKAADIAAQEAQRQQDEANNANPVSGAMGWDCNAVKTNFKDGTWTITRSDNGAVIERGSGSARPSTPAGSYDDDGNMVCSGKGVGGVRSAGGLPGPGSVPGRKPPTEEFYTPPTNNPPAEKPSGRGMLFGGLAVLGLGVAAVVVGGRSQTSRKSEKKAGKKNRR